MMKRNPVVYSAEFGVVLFLAKGPCTASVQEGLDCIGLYHSGLERALLSVGRRAHVGTA